MASGQLSSVIRYIRRVAGAKWAGNESDEHLLERFALRREEAAFAVLVQRHGPMVLGVCRRVLHNLHDAEDAFQAAFLVLARKSASIRKRESVGSWLYGVAYRIALRAKADATRRQIYEHQAADVAQASPEDAAAWRELWPVLDEELQRLPDKYRAPLVLCYLEGKTNEEAAQQLGWTKGTVSGRLARARGLLRTRLTRRGLAVAPAALAVVLSSQSVSAAVPATLAESTVQAATLFAAGKLAAGAVSAPAVALAEGVLKTMSVAPLKIVAAALLAVGLLASGAGVLSTHHALAQKQSGSAQEAGSAPAGGEQPKTKSDLEKLQGTWLPVSGERAGQDATEEFKKEINKFLISGDRIGAKSGDRISGGKFKLDPTKKPKQIDIVIRNKTMQGIYSLEGDILKLCGSEVGDERPTEFKTQEGTKVFVMVFKLDAKANDHKELDNINLEEAAGREASANNLKQIGLAMHNYHDTNGNLPPAAIYRDGKPLLSWRVAILPFLDQQALYDKFKLDEPWDSEHNKKLLAEMPDIFAPVVAKTKEKGMTFYQVFTGAGTAFEGTDGLKITDFTDGTSNTILAIEGGEAVPWTKPADLPYDADKPLPKLGGEYKDVITLLIADGSVRFIKKEFDEKALRAAITRNGGEVVDLGDLDK